MDEVEDFIDVLHVVVELTDNLVVEEHEVVE